MFSLLLAAPGPAEANCKLPPQVCIDSLQELAVPQLRQRDYDSDFKLIETIDGAANPAFMASYSSDGLRLYSRIDLPASPTDSAYPVVVLAPGWIEAEEALNWDFGAGAQTTVGSVRQALVQSGFAVVTVGYRGRGNVQGVPAEGMEFRDAWGNGSYLSPMFYAVDVLNAIAGLASLNRVDFPLHSQDTASVVAFDPTRVSLWGHSQGGDVASTALAVIGGNEMYPQPLLAASIWSGNIPDRFTQASTFGPMGSSLQAFMSGDGTWTGSATGRKGEPNPDFVFAWPADWIGTLDTTSEAWSWQAEQWSTASVAEALQAKYGEMYKALNEGVRSLEKLSFTLEQDDQGRSTIKHAAIVAQQMPKIGAYHHAHLIDTPLALHISDRDYYSLPAWNEEFARRINAGGGSARVYTYPGTTHSLRASKHSWFSPPGTADGVPSALARDLQLFLGGSPED